MRVEYKLFVVIGGFFSAVGLIYGMSPTGGSRLDRSGCS
jgi:hypothetical protein